MVSRHARVRTGLNSSNPCCFVYYHWIYRYVPTGQTSSALHYTFLGQFEYAKSIVNPQWFLNISSVYFFAIYDAYENTVSNNKLFDWEQIRFLKKNYQDKNFNMPFKKTNVQGD